MEKENDIQKQIDKLEKEIQASDFWGDKNKAQSILKELAELKNKKAGANKYDKGSAIITIISGAGGDDAEDFGAMLLSMYMKYANKKGWKISFIQHGGYKNVSFELVGKGVYGLLKSESGVHRLVRISPFNAKKLRHTSFSLVEVLPKFSLLEEKDIVLLPEDLKIEFSRSSGPGGQNVNKRETAVRLVHLPTGIAVHVDAERSQGQNKERAMGILKSKLYSLKLKEREKEKETMWISKTVEAEWGHQIRSYVFHPYKMVKDHRTEVETGNVDAVLNGELDEFIEAERKLANSENVK